VGPVALSDYFLIAATDRHGLDWDETMRDVRAWWDELRAQPGPVDVVSELQRRALRATADGEPSAPAWVALADAHATRAAFNAIMAGLPVSETE
jgi:hypothetical protein